METSQQPAVLLMTLCGVLGIALIPIFQLHQFAEAGQMARDGGLAAQLTLGLLLAVGAAGSALYGEIATGTAAAAISKPLSRELFFLGKFCGIGRIVTHFWGCLLIATLLAERVAERYNAAYERIADSRAQGVLIVCVVMSLLLGAILNHRRRARFGVVVFRSLLWLLLLSLLGALLIGRDGQWHPSLANLDWRIVPVSLLILAALWLFTALASALSAYLKPGPTLIVCLLLLALGLSCDTLLAAQQPLVARLPAYLAPNMQSFWLADALLRGGRLPLAYLAHAIAYAMGYCAALLGVGMLALRQRDIG